MADHVLHRYERFARGAGWAQGTVTLRLRRVRQWFEFAGDGWDSATWREAEAWVDDHDGDWSATTSAHAMSHLRAFYWWARREGLTGADPTADAKARRIAEPLPRVASDFDVARALLVVPEPWRRAVVLAAGAGLRCMEVAAARWDDVDVARAEVRVRAGKGGKGRVAGLSPQMRAELARYDGGRGLVLGRQVTASRVSQACNAQLAAAGITTRMHGYRHWYATALLSAPHGDLEKVRMALGHSSIATTQRYVHVEAAEVVAAAAGIRWV